MRYVNANSIKSQSIPKSRMKGSQLPSYDIGGFIRKFNNSDIGNFMSDNAGAISSLGNNASGTIAMLDQLDGNTSLLGSSAAGLAKGASMGMQFGPMGALIGAGVGAIGGGIMGHYKSKAEEETERKRKYQEIQLKQQNKKMLEAANMQASQAILNSFPSRGINDSGFAMAYGGPLKPTRQTGRESIPIGTLPKFPTYQDLVNKKDSFSENVLEFLDPTGVLSYDDAAKAYSEWRKSNNVFPNFNQSLDMLGAVPIAGKVKYLKSGPKIIEGSINVGRYLDAIDSSQDIYQDQLRNEKVSLSPDEIIKKQEEAKRLIENFSNDRSMKSYGGNIDTEDSQYLAEDQEVITHSPDDAPDTDENGEIERINSTTSKFVGDTHNDPSEGIGASNDKEAIIYSNRLYVPNDLLKKINSL